MQGGELGPDQGRLSRRHPAGRRRSAQQPLHPARPEEDPGRHEGRHLLQEARISSARRAGQRRWRDGGGLSRSSPAGHASLEVLGVSLRRGESRERLGCASRPLRTPLLRLAFGRDEEAGTTVHLRRWFWVWLFGLPLWRSPSGASSTTGAFLRHGAERPHPGCALFHWSASSFTLVFGLLRNVNLAHGSLYLLGAYVGWHGRRMTGSWFAGGRGGLPVRGASWGSCCRSACSASCSGQDLRQTMATIALSIIAADMRCWI